MAKKLLPFQWTPWAFYARHPKYAEDRKSFMRSFRDLTREEGLSRQEAFEALCRAYAEDDEGREPEPKLDSDHRGPRGPIEFLA